jgi:pimeloyl-ACP methyl ester carboxylesterase
MKKLFFPIFVSCFLFLNGMAFAALTATPSVAPRPYPNQDDPYRGSYGIWYRTNGPHNSTLKKPLLIVSGFDPSDVVRIGNNEVSDDYGGINKNGNELVYLYDVANKNGFLNNLRAQGYDIIAYRCINSVASIIDNGDNLVSFIGYVNNLKAGSEKLVVAGASMGGLLVCYALTKMEHDGKDHQTRKFISVDAPHKGANVPVGFQTLVRDIAYKQYFLLRNIPSSSIDGSSNELKNAVDILESPAATTS